jgi:hypothetical protein
MGDPRGVLRIDLQAATAEREGAAMTDPGGSAVSEATR